MIAPFRSWLFPPLLALALVGGYDAAAQGVARHPLAPAAVTPGGASARMPAPSYATTRAQVNAVLGPLRLVRALSPDTIERLLLEAESLYRSQNHTQAFEAFATVVELEPRSIPAWLRLGNLHQQAERDGDAIDAYDRASRGHARTVAEVRSQGKALLNIALLGVAQADRAIEAFDDIDPRAGLDSDELRPVRDELVRRVATTRDRVDRIDDRLGGFVDERSEPTLPDRRAIRLRAPAAGPDDGRESWRADDREDREDRRRGVRPARGRDDFDHRRGDARDDRRVDERDRWRADRVDSRHDDDPDGDTPPPTRFRQSAVGAAVPSRRSAADDDRSRSAEASEVEARAHEPYTVDRWTGRSRRATARASSGRSLVVEPLTDAPPPAARPVDVLRGGPSSRSRP
jgi:hypothetical protein